MRHPILSSLVVPILFIQSTAAVVGAQSKRTPAEAQNEADTQPPDAPAGTDSAVSLEEKVRRMEETLSKQSDELAALKAKTSAQQQQNEALETKLDEVATEAELAKMDKEEFDSGTDQLLSIFGFFDLTYFKGFFKKNALYGLYIPRTNTFTITNTNVYIKSQMTPQLSAIAEFRFSFLPQGVERQYEEESILPDGTVVSSGAVYQRDNTRVMDPITMLEFEQGGVSIERVHITYSPFDWFNIVAGRFLTPFGIWNIDHGSPVVLPARIPMLLYREPVPLAQTGLQVFGRFFPGDRIYLDYAVTLSNGRGPIESVMDLDEDKGVGLRLRLAYSGNHISFKTGAYGYTGKVSDVKKKISVRLNTDGSIDYSQDDALRGVITYTSKYREYCLTYDLLLSVFDFTLQAEGAVTRVRHQTHRELGMDSVIGNEVSLTETWYMPDYTGYGAYILLSYKLPIPVTWLQITPYFSLEKSVPQDVIEIGHLNYITAGLNFKPSPFVSLKGEYMRSTSKRLDTLHSMTLQMAVSF